MDYCRSGLKGKVMETEIQLEAIRCLKAALDECGPKITPQKLLELTSNQLYRQAEQFQMVDAGVDFGLRLEEFVFDLQEAENVLFGIPSQNSIV
jgi:hypothetical protein